MNCLTILIIAHKTSNPIANFKFPFTAHHTAHGNIAVPEPNIGKASTNPIPNAAISGTFIPHPIKWNIYSPIRDITKEIKIKIACAFKYLPNVFINSLIWIPIFFTHVLGRWCSNWSNIYTLSTHIKYKAKKVITTYMPIVGIDVIKPIADVNTFLAHSVIVPKNSVAELCNVAFTCSDIWIFSKLKLFIVFCIKEYPLSKNWLIFPNIFEISEISVAIPHVSNPIIIENAKIKTIIALVFLFNLVFLINTFIIGSKSKDIIKAIKNGI